MKIDPNERKPVSIGRLAAETGISTERLRIWERRYGNPKPMRLPSGHRRYSWDQVLRMRRVADLIARGERAGSLLRLTPEELEARFREQAPRIDTDPELRELLQSVAELRGDDLRDQLVRGARSLSLIDFLEHRVAALMHEIGLRWADGRLEIRHEHFACRIVQSVLDDLRPNSRGTAGTVVLATLPGELHGLALRTLALVCLANDYKVHELDVNLPAAEIANAARETGANLAAVSVSSANHLHDSFRDLRNLREMLPADCELLVGGAGAKRGQRGPRGVNVFRDLRAFESWLERSRRSERMTGDEVA